MPFFDDLGKKISQAGQTAVQKTKDFTDVARLNSSISEEEKKINNGYLQIGKLYVSTHPDNYESDFAKMIVSIKESEQKILDYRQKIQDIKGVTRCEKCGAEVANNVAFCPSCGASMAQQYASKSQDKVKCPSCGQLLSKDLKFCTTCGQSLVSVSTEQSVEQVSQNTDQENRTPIQEERQSIDERKCPNCGARIEDEIIFCTECGTKL